MDDENAFKVINITFFTVPITGIPKSHRQVTKTSKNPLKRLLQNSLKPYYQWNSGGDTYILIITPLNIWILKKDKVLLKKDDILCLPFW